ncbi:hypothetical protein [Aureispira anguillae]|uniref:Fibronectin type-III domain-containing protein n=1 Tax=Aureispira anguillae TaxID=2864201 RepID=A0A915YD04_9BACT|nr:hypothetical protein [Aureispira anguillae]BDS10823.1 hypothetical protein AsAng_0015320 [Aureispira anguillae]
MYPVLPKRSCFYFLLIFLFVQTACEKTSSSSIVISSFAVTQSSNQLEFTFASSGGVVQYYELSYMPTANNTTGESGYKFITNNANSITKEIKELNITTGNLYSFYIRVVGDDNASSEWYGPKTINVDAFCESPYSLSFSNGLSWQTSTNTTTASYHEISYGLSGFQVDSGTIITVNNTWHNSSMVLQQGNVYDFYMRSYCNQTLGWSEWEGPLTHYASNNMNTCIPPSGLKFYVVRNSLSQAVGAECHWDDLGGNSNYEVNMVRNGFAPNYGNIETASSQQTTYMPMVQNTEYDFYVRSVCHDGSKTAWAGPLDVNIGQ